MTSFIIKAHEGRELPSSWKEDPECIFCRIIRGDASAFKLYETDKVVAFLDILPLRQGHTLVVPKTHYSRVSELPSEYAAATGEAVSKVANALTKAMNNTGLNIVCNQEYAQAVPHVHYHIIPAPIFSSSSPKNTTQDIEGGGDHRTRTLTQKEMHKAEFETRNELDDDEAEELAKRIKSRL
ncbi:HIT-like protein [Abortiporus biennis]|nr:HIT-like protein [Abortiporus biennis]